MKSHTGKIKKNKDELYKPEQKSISNPKGIHQQIADNSPQVQKMAQLKALAENQGQSGASQSTEVIQRKRYPVKNSFFKEKKEYEDPASFYYKVIQPWIHTVISMHPEARSAAKNALLIGDEYSHDWEKLERLVLGINEYIGTSPDFEGEIEILDLDDEAESTEENKNPFGEDPIFEKRGMTETDAMHLAKHFKLEEVTDPRWVCSDVKHSPKGKVYYSKKTKNYYGADNTGHVGYGFKVWSKANKGAWTLDYLGNTPHTMDRLIKR